MGLMLLDWVVGCPVGWLVCCLFASSLGLVLCVHVCRPPGASDIFRALAQREPPHIVSKSSSSPPPSPLWLRMEHNLVDVPAAHAIMKNLQLQWCDAGSRSKCGSSKCAVRPCPDVHLFCFRQQRQRIGPLLRGMLESEACASRVLSPRKVKFAPDTPLRVALGRKEHTKGLKSALSVGDLPSLEDGDLLSSKMFPMMIVLHSSAVLDMVSGDAAPFTWANILRHAPSLKGQIVLVVLETVLRQLDRLKRESTSKREAVNSFFSTAFPRSQQVRQTGTCVLRVACCVLRVACCVRGHLWVFRVVLEKMWFVLRSVPTPPLVWFPFCVSWV